MGSWHFSSPNWKMHSSLTFFVSLHTQQMRLPAAFVVGAAAAAGAADVEEVAVAELMILFECFRDGDCVAMRRPEEIDQCKMRHANFVISRFCSLVAARDKHFQVNTSHTTHSSILGQHFCRRIKEKENTN
jgi:hypothetical protein